MKKIFNLKSFKKSIIFAFVIVIINLGTIFLASIELPSFFLFKILYFVYSYISYIILFPSWPFSILVFGFEPDISGKFYIFNNLLIFIEYFLFAYLWFIYKEYRINKIIK